MKLSAEVLVLTVGTGNMDRLEETLFQPLEKSLKNGNFKEAVLLPSTMTEENAREFKDRMVGYSIEIKPLPEVGQENDADACFSHFDRVLTVLREMGYEAKSITPDFTRGTKAMSAALVLAAVRHQIPRLRYIQGARDKRGMVLAGQEEVSEVATGRATMRRQFDYALKLMSSGAFAGVLQILPDDDGSNIAADLVPEEFHSEISRLRRLATFWSAWDRLDYREAVRCSNALCTQDAEALKEEVACVKRLEARPVQDNHDDMAEWLRRVAADLLANGHRRIKHHQFEDALLRAYRVVELIGQIRLFCQGYDSARIDPEDSKVKEFRKHLKKNRSEDFGTRSENNREVLTASRMLSARFLKKLGDPVGKCLVNFDQNHGLTVKTSARNDSILIHGFSVAGLDESSLSELYDRIRALLDEDYPDNAHGFDPSCFGIVPKCRHSTSQNRARLYDGEQGH